jgi:hypothetical protein
MESFARRRNQLELFSNWRPERITGNVRLRAESPRGNAPVRKRNKTAKGTRVKPNVLAKYASIGVAGDTSVLRRATISRGEKINGRA